MTEYAVKTAVTGAPVHGGDLSRAKRAFPDQKQWLDLSAGLNPNPWPVPDIPQRCFQRLPDGYGDLLAVAADYYQHPQLYPLNGSQQAIELLPVLFQAYQQGSVMGRLPVTKGRPVADTVSGKKADGPIKVAVPVEGYAEHAWCWQKSGFQVVRYQATTDAELQTCAEANDIVVVINPNNPTGHRFRRECLLRCHQVLSAKGGWLVVDEAFMDAFEDTERARLSVANRACDSLLVLRSIGKFFGLAGIRSGFLLTGAFNLAALQHLLGPWPVSGVTAWLTEQMLRDRVWQEQARQSLAEQSCRLVALLQGMPGRMGLFQVSATPLFVSLQPELANAASSKALQDNLARQGVWVRYFADSGRLRLGLPGNRTEEDILAQALARC